GTFTSIISKIAKNNPSVMSPRRGSYKYIKKKYHNGDNFDEMAIATLEELVIVINNLPKHINPLYVTKKQQKIFNVLKNNIKFIILILMLYLNLKIFNSYNIKINVGISMDTEVY